MAELKPVIEHFVLTRFSFRAQKAFTSHNESLMWQLYEDPLIPENLEFRFKLFEIFSLPSILNQSYQNFKWILVIDKNLPDEFKERLKDLIHGRDNTFLCVFEPGMKLEKAEWLMNFSKGDPDYILTTNLDDDDLLPVHFLEVIHNNIHSNLESGNLPPFKIFMTTNVRQWDLVSSFRSPYGVICNKKPTPSNIGFSLLAKYPDYQSIVWDLRHTLVLIYTDLLHPKVTKKVEYVRKTFGLNRDSKHFKKWSPLEFVFDLNENTSPVLLVNHFKNVQQWRLLKRKQVCSKYSKKKMPDDLMPDHEKLEAYKKAFSKGKALFHLMKILADPRYMKNKFGARPEGLLEFFYTFIWFLKR